jgi:hypothetical protein
MSLAANEQPHHKGDQSPEDRDLRKPDTEHGHTLLSASPERD